MDVDDARQAFRQTVSEAIDASGLTQSEVAAAVGVTQTTVSAWVVGKSLPEPPAIRVLAELFTLNYDRLLELKLAAMAGAKPRGGRRPGKRKVVIHPLNGKIDQLSPERRAQLEKQVDKWLNEEQS